MADESVQQPEEEKTEDKKPKKEVKTSSKVKKLIEEVESLSVLELSELVKALEEKFGPAQVVAAAAPTPQTAGAAASTPTGTSEGEPEQTTFNVILTNAGANKISVIKAVREINQTLGLKEAKDLVEAAPKEILNAVNKETAEEAKKKLEDAGAQVELK